MHKSETPGTAKRGLFRIVFSRTGIILLLILLQIVLFMNIPTYLGEHMNYMYGLLMVAEVVVLIYIINSEGNPAFKMTWILFVIALPVIGTLFFLYVKVQPGTKLVKQRLSVLKIETDPYMCQDEEVVRNMRASRSANANLAY